MVITRSTALLLKKKSPALPIWLLLISTQVLELLRILFNFIDHPALLPGFFLFQIIITWYFIARFSRKRVWAAG